MLPARHASEWDTPELRAAAADYCAAATPPRGRPDAEWRARCAALHAGALGIAPGKLERILTGWRESPAGSAGRDSLDGDAIPDPETALASLLAEEDWTLAEHDRADLAAALEAGIPLTASHRAALASLIRSSGSASRAAVVRGLLNWLCNRLTAPGYIIRERQITVPRGALIEVLPAGKKLMSAALRRNNLLAGQHVRITTPHGPRVYLYSIIHRREYGCREGLECYRIHSLHPHGTLPDDAGLRKNLTLLAAFIQNDRTPGSEWAKAFGETRAMVSVRRRKLTDALNTPTGGKTHLPGMRSHADPRKGTRITKTDS